MTGSGTVADPYIITTRADLEAINSNMTACYQLGADIDLAGVDWMPLGTTFLSGYEQAAIPFTGTFDGNNHTIRNMLVDISTSGGNIHQHSFGLFACLYYGATAKNLKFEKCAIKITDTVDASENPYVDEIGILAGVVENSSTWDDASGTVTVSNVSVCDGAITLSNMYDLASVGLLIGSSHLSIQCSDCQAQGTITISSRSGYLYLRYVGGIIGLANAADSVSTTITRCSSDVSVDCNGKITQVGGLVGWLYPTSNVTSISECTTKLTLDAQSAGDIGGCIGWIEANCTIQKCRAILHYTSSSSTPKSSNVGGFAGYVTGNNSAISDCAADGNISSACDYAGGFVGQHVGTTGTCTRCSSSTDIAGGGDSCGGFVGYVTDSKQFTDCYAIGDVQGNNGVGGFVGSAYGGPPLTFTHCYSAGYVQGASNVGGFCGQLGYPTAVSCYWDTEASGQASSALMPDTLLPMGTGKTTAEMQTQSTFVGWDFDTVWNIASGTYPFLRTEFVKLVDKCAKPIIHSFPWVGKFSLTRVV